MDNHHVHIARSGISCGVIELSGLTAEPEKVLYALATNLYHPARGTPAAFVIWSDVVPDSNGLKLCRYLNTQEGSLWGRATMTATVENPMTSNPIAVFIWAIPHEALKKWYIEKRIERARKL